MRRINIESDFIVRISLDYEGDFRIVLASTGGGEPIEANYENGEYTNMSKDGDDYIIICKNHDFQVGRLAYKLFLKYDNEWAEDLKTCIPALENIAFVKGKGDSEVAIDVNTQLPDLEGTGVRADKQKINIETDFVLQFTFVQEYEGDFRIIISSTGGDETIEASRVDGILTNAEIVDNMLGIVCKDHNFKVGYLEWKIYTYHDTVFAENMQVVTSRREKILFTKGNGDELQAASISAILPYSKGEKGDKGDIADNFIVQTTGTAIDKVMSQNAVSNAIITIQNKIDTLDVDISDYIVQETGSNTDKIMSQDAVSKELAILHDEVEITASDIITAEDLGLNKAKTLVDTLFSGLPNKLTVVKEVRSKGFNFSDYKEYWAASSAKTIIAYLENNSIAYTGGSGTTLIKDILYSKQDALTFDTTPTADSTNPVTSGGIYSMFGDTELLAYARAKYIKHSYGINFDELSEDEQEAYLKTIKEDLASDGIYDLMADPFLDLSNLVKVATTGDYNDLSNLPTIPTVPTKVSAFENDEGYLTEHQDISGKANSVDIPTKVSQLKNDSEYIVESDVTELMRDAFNVRKLDTYTREYPTTNWNTYGTIGYNGSWMQTANYTDFSLGDYGIVYGIDTTTNEYVAVLGIVTTITSSLGMKTLKFYRETEAFEINTYIPSKTSQIRNDSGYLTSHQSLTSKQDLLVIGTNLDSEPVENSTNPITSGGVYTALADIPTDVYTKQEVDEKITSSGSFDSTQYYTKSDTDSLLNNKLDSTATSSSATKLATARTIALGTGAVSTATSFDGTANITIPVTSVKEAYLSWGGKNFVSSYGPIDAAMVPELGANRLAFMPAKAVTIEYSRDAGETWVDYEATDEQKVNIFSGNQATLISGKNTSTDVDFADYQLRITINNQYSGVYTILNKFVLYVGSNGAKAPVCTIEGRNNVNYNNGEDTWTTYVENQSVLGWSGYNVINTSGIRMSYSSTDPTTTRITELRFTFKDVGTPNESNYKHGGFRLYKIFGFGGVGWGTPSTMAKTGHLYSYNYLGAAIFPSSVTATSFNGNATSATAATSATKATQDSAGNVIVDTYATKVSIPTKTSALTNDSGFLTEHQSLSEYAKIVDLPAVPSLISAFTNDVGYLTEHQSLSSYAKTADIPTVPTKVSAFENDAEYLTASTLPSYVDDVIEIYINSDTVYSEGTYNESLGGWEFSENSKITTFEKGKIYVDLVTDKSYRWSGSALVEISKSIGIGTTANTAFAGNRGLALEEAIKNYITTETDPIFTSSAAYNISATDITNWNSKSTFSGNYNDLTDKPTIPTTVASLTDAGDYLKTTDISDWAKASSKPTYSYSEINNAPTVIDDPGTFFNTVASEYMESNSIINTYVAKYSFEYLENLIPSVSDWAKASTKPTYTYSEISGTPSLAKVATSGSYNDLSDKPTIPTTVAELTDNGNYLKNSDISEWAKTDEKPTYTYSEISGTPTLATVATTGSYNDLKDKPTIPSTDDFVSVSDLVEEGGNLTEGTNVYTAEAVDALLTSKANSSSLATVATSGSYNDLSNKPTIPSTDNCVKTTNVYSEGQVSTEHMVYSISATDTLLSSKADSSSLNSYVLKSSIIQDGDETSEDFIYSSVGVDALLGNKVDKETGKGLSTNDYTTDEKTKLANISSYTIGEGLTVEDGVLKCSFTPTRYYTGSSTPNDDTGNNGDLYLLIS